MEKPANSNLASTTRRAALLKIGVFGGALGALALPAAVLAEGHKLAQKAVAYQGTPKGKQRCDICMQWQPPAACKVVDGAISASGWCTVYAQK